MLKIPTKTRYALRIAVYLAKNSDVDHAVNTAEIAKNEGISVNYATQILGQLNTNEIVGSRRGIGGGVFLVADPQKTTVADVIRAMTGPICLVPCIDRVCQRTDCCSAKAIWSAANDALVAVFENYKLNDLAQDLV